MPGAGAGWAWRLGDRPYAGALPSLNAPYMFEGSYSLKAKDFQGPALPVLAARPISEKFASNDGRTLNTYTTGIGTIDLSIFS